MIEFLEGAIASPRFSNVAVPAAAVSQAWSRLRAPGQEIGIIEESLRLLAENKKSLHVGEAQVRFLLSMLAVARDANYPRILGTVWAWAALVISVWVRRSLLNSVSTASASVAATLDSVARTYCEILQDEAVGSCSCCQSILLLGAVCATRECRDETRRRCQAAIVEELGKRKERIATSSSLPEALAGVGYAVMGSWEDYSSVPSIMTGSLIFLWTMPVDRESLEDGGGGAGERKDFQPRPSLDSCAMLLKLYEFLGAWAREQRVLEALCEPLVSRDSGALPEVRNAKVAIAAGLLRGSRWQQSLLPLKKSLESMILALASQLLQEICESGQLTREQLLRCIEEHRSLPISDTQRHQLRCIALSMVSGRKFEEAQPELLHCLVIVLLGDVLDVSQIYSPQSLSIPKMVAALEALKTQAGGVFFREVGSLARAVCEHYRGVSSFYQQQIEALFWKYSSKLYERHRVFSAVFSKDQVLKDEMQKSKDLVKALEAVFLTIVLFFSSSVDMLHEREELAAYVLDSFSCVEFLRRFQVDEYTDTVKKCALLVSGSHRASSQLVELLPSYERVISWPGSSILENPDYSWCLDDVQTSRIQFHFRILSSCVQQLDANSVESGVVPILFLYICHPSKQAAEAAHQLFASFLSRRADSAREGSLAEQLGVFYINRAMEGYPDFTPLEGLVAGVVEIVRCLPAGSVTIRHCIDQLVSKTQLLIGLLGAGAASDEAVAAIRALLLHLLLIVDIQVLPHLMQKLSKLILASLPSPAAQEKVLEEVFAVVSTCEDHIRKPALVAWLQSLWFLHSQASPRL
ncbi:uncharacterized protein LOC9650798 [Selaginella moellendorffii]|nr:uncharacterized protein LOC9650798 [Selaginella moellendorffii]|eukprot:XP_002968688.2 uncharacterized protein LOC9650798 [Selaginella moellendorffii]